MIFGNPYKFAIWTDYVPQWGDSYKNGLFYFIVNGNLYPNDVRTSTLSSDLCEIISNDCALISHPQNEEIFSLSTADAFSRLYCMAYPESTENDEYPDQVFDYCIAPPNISDFGGCFFAVANETSLRVIGGITERLVKNISEERSIWESVNQPFIEDVIVSRDEINKIMVNVKEYASSLLK